MQNIGHHHLKLLEALIAVAIVGCGVLLTIWLGQSYTQHEMEQRSTLLNKVSLQLQADLKGREFALFQLANFFQASEQVTYNEWLIFARPILLRYPEITGLGFSPRLSADQLATAATWGRAQQSDFELFELSSQGPRPLSLDRAEYAPLVFVTTRDGGSEALGLDLYSEPKRNSILQNVRLSGSTAISAPLELVNRPGRTSVIVATPILKNQVAGFVVGAIDTERLVASIFDVLPLDVSNVRVRDPNAVDVSVYPSGRLDMERWNRPPPSTLERTMKIYDFGGRTWQFSFDFPAIAPPIWIHAGWLIPLLLSFIVLRELMGRRRAIVETQAEVRAATRSLASANQSLLLSKEELTESVAHLNRKNRELESFVYVASHDLKAPLRGIRNLTDWLIEDLNGSDVPPQVIAHSDKLSLLADRMGQLIEGLLTYSRAKVSDKFERIVVSEMIDDICKSITLSDRPFKFELIGSRAIMSDRMALSEVLHSLIQNAVRHNDKAIPEIRLVIRMERHLVFELSDNGPGIPQDARERMFEVFQTLQPDGLDVAGLGLAVVRKIVSFHGGEIGLKDAQSGGCMVRFTWPKFDVADAAIEVAS